MFNNKDTKNREIMEKEKLEKELLSNIESLVETVEKLEELGYNVRLPYFHSPIKDRIGYVEICQTIG